MKSLADDLKQGKMGWDLHHDPRTQLDVRVLDAFTRADAERDTEAIVVVEVDEQEWNEKGGDTDNGFSLSGTQRLLGEPDGSPSVSVAADAHWFTDEQITAAFEALQRTGAPIQALRLYQFAAEPTALVLLTFLLQQISTIPASLLCSYIYDALRNFITADKQPSKPSLTFVSGTGSVAHAYLETDSDRVLKHAMDTLPATLSRVGEHEYDASERAWETGG